MLTLNESQKMKEHSEINMIILLNYFNNNEKNPNIFQLKRILN